MHDVFFTLLILLGVVWTVAVILRRFGLPTIMGELVGGVIVGPAVLGLVEPNAIIDVLAQMGIFFLMLHAGVETSPREFLSALRVSWGVALVGAIVPFAVAALIALAFGQSTESAIFIGLTMTATAVVITIKSLREFNLMDTGFARIIVASCVIDDLLTLVFFGVILGLLQGGEISAVSVLITLFKVVVFFAVSLAIGYVVYPRLRHPFQHQQGKGFTFILLLALCAGVFADWIGLHVVLGAYLAGLFFEPTVAHPVLFQKVSDRLYGIAYSFLGPIFFISLGFNLSFDVLLGAGLYFVLALTAAVFIGQVASAGGMALRLRLPWTEALTIGVGMCGRAEMAFILASLGLGMRILDDNDFSVVIFTAFLLNLITPVTLKGCAYLMHRYAAPSRA